MQLLQQVGELAWRVFQSVNTRVPDGRPVRTRALDLEGEMARRGIPMPAEI